MTAVPPGWSERCLAVSRGAAVAAAGAVPFSSALTSTACAVMLASWLVSGRVAATLRTSLRHPVGVALLVFLALAAAGTLYGSASRSEALDALWGWRRFGYALIFLGIFGAAAWKNRLLAVFLAVSSAGAVASLLSTLGLVGSRSADFGGIVLQNHATQGIVFSLAVVCAAHYARSASGYRRWALFALMAAFAANVLFVTPGRSGYAALLIACIAAAAMLYGWRRAHFWLPATAALAAAAFVTSPLLQQRVLQGFDELSGARASPVLTSMGVRSILYETTLELIRERPVLGHGTGSFGAEYSARVARRYTGWRATPSTDPHNQYLFIALELGLVGLVAFGAVLVAGFVAARSDPYGWIAGAALAMWCVTSLFSSHFRTFPEGHLIGLFLGTMLAAPRSAGGVAAGSA